MGRGYTQTELDGVQAKWSLRFPPDLLAIYRERRFVIGVAPEREMDVVIYGANLDDYVLRELGSSQERNELPWLPAKEIRFWTRAVEYNGADRHSVPPGIH